MAATFQISSPKRGQYHWVLTERGKTLAIGATYTRKASCEKAIASFRKGAALGAINDTTAAPAAKGKRSAAAKRR